MTRLGLALCLAFAVASAEEELREPFQVLVGEKPVDVEIGHAAPFVADMDGDGAKDLLVGQFGGGKCTIFRNVGTTAAPKLDGGAPLMAGGAEATVPAG